MTTQRRVGPVLSLALLAALAGCHNHKNPKPRESDNQAVAMVKRMNQTPLKPVVPQVLNADIVQRYGLDRPGCLFVRDGDANKGAIFFAGAQDGYMLVDGDLQRFAAREDTAQITPDARTGYVGLRDTVDFLREPSDMDSAATAVTSASDASSGAPHGIATRMIVHDPHHRVVFTAEGVVNCHSR